MKAHSTILMQAPDTSHPSWSQNDFSLLFMPLTLHFDSYPKQMKSSPSHLFLYQAPKMFNKFLLNESIFLLVSLMIKNPHFQNDGPSDSPRPGCPNQLLASANPHSIYRIWPVHSPQTCRYKLALTQSLWYLFPPMNQKLQPKFYPQVFHLASHWSSLTHRHSSSSRLAQLPNTDRPSGLHCQGLTSPF